METYLVDRDILSKVVDSLIAQKFPEQPAQDEIEALREDGIKRLDSKISKAIFSHLDDDEIVALGKLLDDKDTTSEVFNDFFDNSSIDISQVIAGAIKDFSQEFLKAGEQHE